MTTILAVAVGGAVGAVGRYTLSNLLQTTLGTGLPWGTLAVNVLGSFAMGALFGALERGLVSPEVQALAAVGILGSFTTFSAFSLETLRLAQEGAPGRAVLYVLISVAVGLAAALVGMALTGAGTGLPGQTPSTGAP